MALNYVDTNIFVHAYGKTDLQGPARALLLERASSLATTFLAIDEFVWVMRKAAGMESALAMAELIMASGIDLLPVGRDEALVAMDLMRRGLHPHDATHAAVALAHCDAILSTDPDFDKVGLVRIGLE